MRHKNGHAERSACPSREELANYSLGKVTDVGLGRIARHIECCHACETTLLGLDDADDTLVSKLRALKGAAFDTRPDDEPAFRALEARLRSIRLASIEADEPAVVDRDGVELRPDGKRIGRYGITAEIGSGGMGTVYRAYDDRLKRDVALKILHHHRCKDPEFVKRFSREMESIGRLDHQHVVRALDAGESEGSPFLVMEFVEGADLSHVVRQLGPLGVADACEVIRQAAVGLQYIQQKGLVHRDIKPSNLLLSVGGTVKIVDLGLARLQRVDATQEELTASGQWVGTADYMAPEQADDARDPDIRADIYGLGCTLYKLLAGRAPFQNDQYATPQAKINGHTQQTIPSIRSINPDVPPRLASVLAKMLAKEPDQRFQLPGDVADAVGPFASASELSELVDRAREASLLRIVTPPPSRDVKPTPKILSRRNAIRAFGAGAVAIGAGMLVRQAVWPSKYPLDETFEIVPLIPMSIDSHFGVSDSNEVFVHSEGLALLCLGETAGVDLNFSVDFRQLGGVRGVGIFFGFVQNAGEDEELGYQYVELLQAERGYLKVFHQSVRGTAEVPRRVLVDSTTVSSHRVLNHRLAIDVSHDNAPQIYLNSIAVPILSASESDAQNFAGEFGMLVRGANVTFSNIQVNSDPMRLRVTRYP